MSGYVIELGKAIEDRYKCQCIYFGTEEIEKYHDGKLALYGEVEVFQLKECSEANVAYGWGWKKDADGIEEVHYIGVLKVPPVESGLYAVMWALNSGLFQDWSDSMKANIHSNLGNKD